MGITIYVANLAKVNQNNMTNIISVLTGYWNQVLAGTSSSLTGVKEVTSKVGLNLADTDLLCYIVAEGSKSVVKKFRAGIDTTGAGNTVFKTNPSTAASEVYLKQIALHAADPDDIGKIAANLIFHELMHNKSMTDDAMHNSQDGLGKEEVLESDTLTSTNISYLKPFLATPVKQWNGGF